LASIFISYRRADLTEAERLAEAVRAAGHDVWLDDWRIDIGDSITGEMDTGLAGARYLVMCYSEDGVHSPWMSREWHSALARQLEGHDIRLLPVRLTGGQPPAILADIRYADLVADWDGELAALLRAIR